MTKQAPDLEGFLTAIDDVPALSDRLTVRRKSRDMTAAFSPVMRQEMKDKFEKQGLAVVALVGGADITPDLKDEMVKHWLPDLTRFNYPILIDIDIERGVQGSAYPNFNLGGRNNILLDSKGRVVFASRDFVDNLNELALYQALAQIGFSISSADLENASR